MLNGNSRKFTVVNLLVSVVEFLAGRDGVNC